MIEHTDKMTDFHHRDTEYTECLSFFADREVPIGQKPLPFGQGGICTTFRYMIWSEWAHLLSHGPAKGNIPAPHGGAEDFDLAASRAKSKNHPLCDLCVSSECNERAVGKKTTDNRQKEADC